jgi:hypothetical protein
MFNVFGFGMSSPEDKYKFFEQKKEQNIAAQKEKIHKGIFWKKNIEQKTKSNFDISSMGGTGPLDETGKQILPSDKNYPSTNINQMQKQATYKDQIMQGGKGVKQGEDPKWWEKLGAMAGVDMTKAAAQWKDKGGFEGLMANPAFTMGLAFMQAGAEGKTLGQGALDNVMKSAGISSHYKRLMEAKSGGVTEVTTGQMDQIKSVLGTKGISAPILRKLLPGNQSEMYQQAVEDIAFKVQKKVNTMKEAAKASGKDIEVGSRLYKKIIDEMIASGEISTKGGINVGGYQIIDRTLESKARGGPVAKGKTYVVGEGGPEYFLPKQSGKILSNDDSRIFAMLLTANPQLQQVSRTRAEKILRNRFPEYFE